jgi:hypothetical protein
VGRDGPACPRRARLFVDHGHLRGQGPSGVSLPAHPWGRFCV